jgi:hypothetical protein
MKLVVYENPNNKKRHIEKLTCKEDPYKKYPELNVVNILSDSC